MKRIALFVVVAFVSLTSFAQQPAAAKEPEAKPVMIINGDIVTAQTIDQLYSLMNAQTREQYDKNGGKKAFLDNYLRKRLVVQEAMKHGFDKRPYVQAEMDAAKEAALFQAYIREVVSQQVVSDTEVKKFYDENLTKYATPEEINARHIIIMTNGAGPHPKSKDDAINLIHQIAEELRESTAKITDPQLRSRALVAKFAEEAKKYSEDGSAPDGGSLGWMARGALDSKFEEVAFALEPGTVSPVVETRYGFHLILVEGKRSASTRPFDEVRRDIREQLQSQHMTEIMSAVTKLSNELKGDSKIAAFPENLH